MKNLFLFLLFIIFSCNNRDSGKGNVIKPSYDHSSNNDNIQAKIIDSNEISNLNLLINKSLTDKDFYYSFRDSFKNIEGQIYFRLADYGYLYNPCNDQNNLLGNADILLIPRLEKKNNFFIDRYLKSKNKLLKIDSLEKYVNEASLKVIRNEFYIYVIILPKKYLQYDNSRGIFIPKELYKLKLYEFDNNWKLIDSTRLMKNDEESELIDKIIKRKLESI